MRGRAHSEQPLFDALRVPPAPLALNLRFDVLGRQPRVLARVPRLGASGGKENLFEVLQVLEKARLVIVRERRDDVHPGLVGRLVGVHGVGQLVGLAQRVVPQDLHEGLPLAVQEVAVRRHRHPVLRCFLRPEW